MNTTPIMYNNKQFETLEEYIAEKFGARYDSIFHEITSEYVHTDTFIIKTPTGEKQFITCGMGAREMNTPNNFKRCELVMLASNRFVVTREEARVLSAELVRISKFPFRNETWLGTGHTIDTSENFKETFGFDYFAFLKLPLSASIPGIDDYINFLLVVPIYEGEREWCVNNHTLAFLEKLGEKYNGQELYTDSKREPFVPDDLDGDELYDYNLMTTLGIDKPTLHKLCEYLDEQEQNGIEITYEMIGEWVAKNQQSLKANAPLLVRWFFYNIFRNDKGAKNNA